MKPRSGSRSGSRPGARVSEAQLLTVREAAAYLGMSRSTFQRLAEVEGLPLVRRGRALVAEVEDLDNLRSELGSKGETL